MSRALVPELAVTDCAASLRFYRDLLGFAVRYQRPEEGFAYLALGEAELMLDEIGKGRTFDDGHAPGARPFGRGLNLQIRVPALAPLAAALGRAAIPLLLEPEEKWYRTGADRNRPAPVRRRRPRRLPAALLRSPGRAPGRGDQTSRHQRMIAFCACSRFSASSNTTECGPSITALVTSSSRCAGRQCMKSASGLAAAITASFT